MPVQLKEKAHKAPTAGPSEDDRFGAGPVGSNVEGRIIKANIVGGRTRIMITRGSAHGVHVGMEGHVKVAGAILATFQIEEVKPNASYASVDVTLDQLGTNALAVINPSSSPTRAATDLRSRVIHVSADGANTRVTIARGSDQGIHAGMSGSLVSDTDKRELDFVVEGVDAARSYTTVHKTVDEVTHHQQVIFRPVAAKRAPIQRRGSGAASTADVQSTADAGVASASSRLPHFDTIQRAFGKHDISNIQSQVGGPATSATASLGAHAYATGNRVAFASSPDLHTAAHEAAHTIQQRHGAVGFQGLGDADDQHEHHADEVADAVVAGQSAEPLLDKLVGGSPTKAIQRKAEETPDPAIEERNRNITLISQGFVWFNEQAQLQLGALQDELKDEDEPDWLASAALSLLGVALSAGAAGAGVWLAEKFLERAVKVATSLPSGQAAHEFFKVTFETGIHAGVHAGASKLGDGHRGNVIAPFMLAQREAVAAAQWANQQAFVLKGQDAVPTVEAAQRMVDTFSRENMAQAARSQQAATRDAWVSYLAQTKYGAVTDDGTGKKADPNRVPEVTTNMQQQKYRDLGNRWAPGYIPKDAPNIADSIVGDAPGVLFVVAELPEIIGDRMLGAPRVEIAVLNGVNEAVRGAYENKGLADVHIPRQLICRVKKGAPDFTINLDERGGIYGERNIYWTSLRARVDHPEHATKDFVERSRIGLKMLLAELVASSIRSRAL